LVSAIDSERDSLRFYFMGAEWRRRVEHVGAKPSWDPEGPLMI
jgi:CRISPR-associated protein Cas2